MPQTSLLDYYSDLQNEDWTDSLVILTAEQIDRQVLFDAEGNYLGEVKHYVDRTVRDVYSGYQGPPIYALTVDGPDGRYEITTAKIVIVDVSGMLVDTDKLKRGD